MKHQQATKLGFLAAALLVAPLLHPAPAAAIQYENPVLAADLDPSRVPDPLDPSLLTVIGDRLYFMGDNIETGREPWVSDGTAAGTRLFEDMCPGPCSSAVAGFGELGGHLVMMIQLGNEARLLKEVGGELETVVALAGVTASFFQLGSRFYFSLYEPPRPDLIYGRSTLMASDGTAVGTVEATNLCSGPVCGPGFSYSKLGDAVYFFASNSALGIDIKRVAAGQPVETIASFGQYVGVDSLRSLDGQRVVFRTTYVLDVFSRVWIYQPGVGRLEIDPSSDFANSQRNSYFVTWRGRLYYPNMEGKVVTTNGTAGDLRYATELTGSSPYVIGGTANHLYYASGDTLRVHRAHNSDQALLSGPGLYWIEGLWGERVLIRCENRLFVTDGTLAGTVELPLVSSISGVPLGGVFVFSGNPGFSSSHLWRTDGSPAGTYEIQTGSTGPASSGARPYAVGGKLIVDTPDAGDGRKLWRVDPETFDAAPISSGALVPLANNGTVMLAQDPETRQVYAVRDAGTPLALPVTGIAQSAGTRVAVAPDGRFFFTDTSEGQELWESDGTVAGTRQLFDLDPTWSDPCGNGAEDCYLELPAAITPMGDKVFFVGHAPGAPLYDNSLWVYDRAGGQVRRLTLPDGFFQFGPQSRLIAVGSRLVFHATEPSTFPRELWQTDGVNVAQFLATEDQVYQETAVAGRLFFSRQGDLWVSDLTPAGTFQLEDVDYLLGLGHVGDHLVYRFRRGEDMRLGFSDGTPAGTYSVAIPGYIDSSSPEEFLPLGDQRLAFFTWVPHFGKAAHLSDGTQAGTLALSETGNPADPRYLAAVGNRLFFQGGDVFSGRELWSVDLPNPKPACPADKLCLHEGRFEVSVEVRPPDGVRQGQRALATSESGVFTFFTPDNWEFLVKVLDGCAINGHFWVYAAAATDVAYTLRVVDRATGAIRSYANPAGQAARSILDGSAFAGCAAEAPPPLYAPANAPPPVAQRCGDDLEELCLGGGRYRVSATWRTATETGKAHAIVNGSADSGLFSFFSPSNWELMVKVLDGCPLNGKRWIFAAGTTDVGFTLRVEDLETGEVKVYENAFGNPAQAIADSNALGGCG
jgi:ELWxxDGT repeat protein